jgi:hypothetical protein
MVTVEEQGRKKWHVCGSTTLEKQNVRDHHGLGGRTRAYNCSAYFCALTRQFSSPPQPGPRAQIFLWEFACNDVINLGRSKLLYEWRSLSEYVSVSSALVGLATRYYFLSECYCLKFPKVEVTLGLMVSQSVSLGFERPCGTCDQILLPVGMLLAEISEGRSYFRTDGHSVSTSWYRAPLWDLRPDITSCCLKFEVLFLWGALSDERTGLQFAVQSLNGPSRAEPVTILYCLIWDSPNLEVRWGYFTSDSQSVSTSWYRAPFWDLRPDITSCLKFVALYLLGALSDERTGLQFTV